MAEMLQQQIIRDALNLIEDEASWTRCALARTSYGRPCGWSDRDSTRYCAVGALGRAAAACLGNTADAHAFAMETARIILEANNRAGSSLPMINDIEGHAVVIQMFERALADGTRDD
jgi:hypothetical protein